MSGTKVTVCCPECGLRRRILRATVAVHGVKLCFWCARKGNFGRRGIGIVGSGRLSARPTRAMPGTPEKMSVMSARAEVGESIFHPDDAVIED